MHSTSEQLQEILKRSDAIQRQRAVRSRIIAAAVGACACVALLIVTSLFIPLLSAAEAENEGAHYGSLLLTPANMGYVVIGVLAFVLGIFVTLLCIYLKQNAEIRRS